MSHHLNGDGRNGRARRDLVAEFYREKHEKQEERERHANAPAAPPAWLAPLALAAVVTGGMLLLALSLALRSVLPVALALAAVLACHAELARRRVRAEGWDWAADGLRVLALAMLPPTLFLFAPACAGLFGLWASGGEPWAGLGLAALFPAAGLALYARRPDLLRRA